LLSVEVRSPTQSSAVKDSVVRVRAGSWSDDGGLEGSIVGGGVGDGFIGVIQVEFGDFELIQIK